MNLTEIQPNHLGTILINYNGTLTLRAREFFGGASMVRIERSSDWRRARLEIHTEQSFLFLKDTYLVHMHYDVDRSSFNFTWTANSHAKFQWIHTDQPGHFHHAAMINTTLIQFQHRTQIDYANPAHWTLQSDLALNGWSFWNVSTAFIDYERFDIRVNDFSLRSRMEPSKILFEIAARNTDYVRASIYLNHSGTIDVSMNLFGSQYQSAGQLTANYTNASVYFPIVSKTAQPTHIRADFSSVEDDVTINVTSDLRHGYRFHAIQNFTFVHQYLARSFTELSFNWTHYPLFTFHSLAYFLENSTVLQSCNVTMVPPSLFFPKPLLFHYQRDSQWLLQLFDWANLTRTNASYDLSTRVGLELTATKHALTRASLRLEEIFLGERVLVLVEFEHQWRMTLTLNRRIQYECISFPSNNSFLWRRTDLDTDQVHLLEAKYSNINQTGLRIELLLSKYFSSFVHDLILDMSMNNDTWTCRCFIPLFRREFFALTWQRSSQRPWLHFQGALQATLFRRRRLIDYEYDWNFASIHLWTIDSRLNSFSFDPLHWHFNLTNDYLWQGRWTTNGRLMAGAHRQLIRFHQMYLYTRSVSRMLVDLHVMLNHFELDVNYHHGNSSLQGHFKQNDYEHRIHGDWNSTLNRLRLDTQDMRTVTTLTSSSIKSIIERGHQRMGLFIERALNEFANDSDVLECNPYMTIHSRPQLLTMHRYTLNDGLSSMMCEWTSNSYVSWNYTGHGRMPLSLRKLEFDTRTKYLFRLHTTTFKYTSILNLNKGQLILRREPVADGADDRYELKVRLHSNRTFLTHLQVIDNHYHIIADPCQEDLCWQLHGLLRHDPFNGSLMLSHRDGGFSSKLDFNGSLYVNTGHFVQILAHDHPQLALEILLRDRVHLAFQYAGWRSLMAVNFSHTSSNTHVFLSSASIDQKRFLLHVRLNDALNQSWTLDTDDERFSLHEHDDEFVCNISLKQFVFRHSFENRHTEFLVDENAIHLITEQFGFILSNRSTDDATRSLHVYDRKSQQNLTVEYYRSGRFLFERNNIETPIYDIQAIYYPNTSESNSVKVLLEFLPLQMSAFSLVRGRSFRVGYETTSKQLVLAGNLAFGLDDLSDTQRISMNERWKLIYGLERHEKLYLKWNVNIDRERKSFRGRMIVEDPNDDHSIPLSSDIAGQLHDGMLRTTMTTVYSASENRSKSLVVHADVDSRLMTQQFVSVRLIHESSKTNLSVTIDHVPQRKLHLSLKPNAASHERTLVHLCANRTESHLKLLLILVDLIHLNLSLPRAHPEAGQLYSSLFLSDDEYFYGSFDDKTLKLRFKEYLWNVSFGQMTFEERANGKILASAFARWTEGNSSSALVTLFTQRDLQRVKPRLAVPTNSWLERSKAFVMNNPMASEFLRDGRTLLEHVKRDLIDEHGSVGEQFIDRLRFDADLQLALQRLNATAVMLIENLFRIGLFGEQLLEEYTNKFVTLVHFHLMSPFDLV